MTRALLPEQLGDAYEEDTGRVIVETLEMAARSAIEAPAVLVASHGPFVWGRTATAAVEAAIALEAIAAMAFRTLAIEASTSEISGEPSRVTSTGSTAPAGVLRPVPGEHAWFSGQRLHRLALDGNPFSSRAKNSAKPMTSRGSGLIGLPMLVAIRSSR